MPEYRQSDDDQWEPAEPMGFQPGLDWEVCGPNSVGPRFTACLYRGNVMLSTVTASNRATLTVRLWLRTLTLRFKGRV